MKIYKLLLTMPALSSVVLPLAVSSCNKTTASVTITINDSDKIIKTDVGNKTASFTLHASSGVGEGNITITNFDVVGGVTPAGKYITVDPNDKTLLYLTVWFDSSVIGGQYCKFNIDLLVNQNTTSSLTGLTITYMDEHNVLPDEAFTFDGTILTGLDSTFDTSSYDVMSVPKKTTSIKEDAFSGMFTTGQHETIKKLCFTNGISIGERAFYDCDSIETIDLSSTTTRFGTIGDDAFTGWNESGTIIYRDDKTYDNNIDFAFCDGGLEKGWFRTDIDRTIPMSDFDAKTTEAGKTYIPKWNSSDEFRHIALLCNTVEFPSDTTYIAENCFWDEDDEVSILPSNITTLSLPSSIKTIGANAFNSAPFTTFINAGSSDKSEEFILPESLTSVDSQAFYNCDKIYYLTLNSKLTSIAEQAFSMTGIYKVIIPKSVTTLKAGAFSYCENLISIDVSQFDAVPPGWANNTFNGAAVEGWILCNPDISTSWKKYFKTMLDIDHEAWLVTDSIDLTKTYTPKIDPATPLQFETKAAAHDAYKTVIEDNSDILKTDIIWSTQKQMGSKFSMFNLKVNNIGVDKTNDTATFMLTYTAQLKDEDVTHTGYLYFLYMKTDEFADVTDTDGCISIKFTGLFSEAMTIPSMIKIMDYDGTNTLKKTYDSDNPLEEISADTVGAVLYNLGLFEIIDDDLTFKINSYHLKDCILKK